MVPQVTLGNSVSREQCCVLNRRYTTKFWEQSAIDPANFIIAHKDLIPHYANNWTLLSLCVRVIICLHVPKNKALLPRPQFRSEEGRFAQKKALASSCLKRDKALCSLSLITSSCSFIVLVSKLNCWTFPQQRNGTHRTDLCYTRRYGLIDPEVA